MKKNRRPVFHVAVRTLLLHSLCSDLLAQSSELLKNQRICGDCHSFIKDIFQPFACDCSGQKSNPLPPFFWGVGGLALVEITGNLTDIRHISNIGDSVLYKSWKQGLGNKAELWAF